MGNGCTRTGSEAQSHCRLTREGVRWRRRRARGCGDLCARGWEEKTVRRGGKRRWLCDTIVVHPADQLGSSFVGRRRRKAASQHHRSGARQIRSSQIVQGSRGGSRGAHGRHSERVVTDNRSAVPLAQRGTSRPSGDPFRRRGGPGVEALVEERAVGGAVEGITGEGGRRRRRREGRSERQGRRGRGVLDSWAGPRGRKCAGGR